MLEFDWKVQLENTLAIFYCPAVSSRVFVAAYIPDPENTVNKFKGYSEYIVATTITITTTSMAISITTTIPIKVEWSGIDRWDAVQWPVAGGRLDPPSTSLPRPAVARWTPATPHLWPSHGQNIHGTLKLKKKTACEN